MNVSSLMPYVGYQRSRASVLEQLLHWNETTVLRDENGHPVILPLLRKLGTLLKLSKATLSRAIWWLADQGFISVARVKKGNAYRLQIRVLIRPRETVGETVVQRQCNSGETAILYSNYSPDTPSILLSSDESSESGQGDCSPEKEKEGPPSPPKICSPSLIRGKAEGAADRVKSAKAQRAEERKAKPPAPKLAAQIWNQRLREFGEAPFDEDPATLSHVKRTLAHLQCKTLEDFDRRIELAIARWYAYRSTLPKFKKHPAHPWVLNRNKATAFTLDPEPEVTPAVSPPEAPKPQPTKKPMGSKILAILKSKQKGYGGGTSNSEED